MLMFSPIRVDSDIPTGRRQRIASDSGSDPDAVRATAEDIFGEADDISEDEQNREDQVNSEQLAVGKKF